MVFSDISRLIYNMVMSYYKEVANKEIRTAVILAYQSYGDFLKFNPHYHTLILEGGFDSEGNFIHIPITDTTKMTECLRCLVIKYFLDNELIFRSLADNLLFWRNSGFSIDNSNLYMSRLKAK